MTLAQRLQQSWQQRGPLAWALLDASWLLGRAEAARYWLYKRGFFASKRMAVPVIVVGNVVAGGAGKTPVVVALVAHLQRRGLRVGVVSRGYGRLQSSANVADAITSSNSNAAIETAVQTASQTAIEVTAQSSARSVGDEPLLIFQATNAPVFVANKRVDAAANLLKAYPNTQVIVCDDGLQHLALQRDIEVCVFDQRGIGNGWLLPAGPLREPWPRKAGRRPVDLVLCPEDSRAASLETTQYGGKPSAKPQGDKASTLQLGGSVPTFWLRRRLASHALRSDGSRVALDSLVGQALHAVAGIAQPEAFFAMLRGAGLQLAHTTALPDHHDYQNDNYDFNSKLINGYAGELLICTEKDAVKLWPLLGAAGGPIRLQARVLAVPLLLDIAPGFYTAIDEKLSSLLV